mgnify:FL=1|jgi:hypothetical protein|tara:strand:+ start:154 stop:510 length:357 start_codon:yes stop_codon:yes gene_type:complete
MGLAKGLKKVSSKTLLRLGGTVTIKRTANSSYNDATGEVIKNETSVNVKGNLENISSVEVNDLISQEDKKLTISAEGLTFTPTTKDKVLISAIEYKIVRVDTNEQDNTAIYYDLFLRA